MSAVNKGFDPQVIQEYREKMKKRHRNHIVVDSEDNSDEYVNFYFIGVYEGREVIYDAVICTLRLHHNSELYEIAEHKAARHFPEFKSIKYEEDENGDLAALDDLEEEIGLYMAEVMHNLEEEGEVKVREYVELDPNIDFGIGLDSALNVEKITPDIISKFVKDYNEESLELDDTLYAFQHEEADEKVI
ncbi:hypothetical protein C900_05111 [Fulvivirga imtechensis AK7]|uniref:Uncharacterized protein n=1 Tax=Fulvivirga imtechensis AK7 TaxID=1237149 RepID=L8JKA6_9BACT|nr:hypothetical protein [Fulvivirga imtechensis]ELR69331.1 hypothetical protein C900_05111 [Fulvivirga imtechensis AK7]